MELIYNYMEDDILRHKLNTLTQKTFGFNFENWVMDGYFEGDYIPYSFMEDGKILSNVSVNRMRFIQNGVQKNYIQIGTVMTDESYRKRGLAGRLMGHVIGEYENDCDGIYLFGDLDALDFYRKMGFEEGLQYRNILKKDWLGAEKRGIPFKKADGQLKIKYQNAVRHSAVNSALEQVNKYGLQMFYTADMGDVYYAEEIDCFAVMEKWDDTLILQSLVSKEHISMKEVIEHIDIKCGCMQLGFTPCAEDADMFEVSAYDGGDDYRLFYRGKKLESIEKEKLFFPQLSHT